VKRHAKALVAELAKLGFDHIWTNASGGQCYVHPGDPAQTEVVVSPSLDERAARHIADRARKLAGADKPNADKRNARQVKERAAAARQRLQESRDAHVRLLRNRADAAALACAEQLVAQRENELAALERLMRQPPAGGNAHRGTGQARQRTGRRP
jgi:hypothetical protein